jgi:hypothetical protein
LYEDVNKNAAESYPSKSPASKAYSANVAYEAVPFKFPVIPYLTTKLPLTSNEPVNSCKII